MLRRLLPPLASIALVVTACTSGPPGPSSAPSFQPGSSPGATNATTAPLLPTGRYDLPTYSADQFDQLLGQLHGTPVVVNFWASWCGPCREEAPGLGAVSREYANKVQFIGVDLKDQRDAALVTIRDFAYPYPSVADPQGAIQRSFGFFAQPVTVFYDGNGDRVMVDQPGAGRVPQYSGAIPENTLRSVVQQLAAG